MTYVKINNPNADYYTIAERWLESLVDTVEADSAPDGYLLLDDAADYPQPAPGEVTAMHVSVSGGVIHLSYVAMRPDDPRIAPPRKLSKLKLYCALARAGLWAPLRAWMEQSTLPNGINVAIAYDQAQVLAEDNELFLPYLSQAKAMLGLTDEQVEAIMSQCVAD